MFENIPFTKSEIICFVIGFLSGAGSKYVWNEAKKIIVKNLFGKKGEKE